MKASTCSKAIRACSNELATITVSPLATARGPSSVAAAIPDKSAVLPLPRATDSPADWVPGAKAPRTKRPCQGSTVKGWPASRPCETVKPDRYSIIVLIDGVLSPITAQLLDAWRFPFTEF